MDVLLDTHVFIWWDQGSSNLASAPRDIISDTANRVFVSAASVWEIAIKKKRGKLDFKGSVAEAVTRNGFVELPITGAEAETAGSLDWDHADPFDRLIVAQAQQHTLTLITADAAVQDFGGVAQMRAR